MKILNLYAGIGGNRKLWGDEHEITSVETDEQIRLEYTFRFLKDKLYGDRAEDYLIEQDLSEYDFIWASPPCPTHSRARYWGWHKKRPVLPDMTLYSIIIFLKHHYQGLWVVENVKPYYDPLIPPTKELGRHLFWANFKIGDLDHKSSDIRKLSGTSTKDKWERNAVDGEIGLHILNAAQGMHTKKNDKQIDLFE